MPPPDLHYAPRPPLHRRHIPIWLWVVTAVAGFLLTTPLWYSALDRHVELLYWQNQCLANITPPTTVTFDRKAGISLLRHDWAHFYAVYSPPGFIAEASLFVGEMKNAAGESRLVCLDVVQVPVNSVEKIDVVEFRSFAIGNILASPELIVQKNSGTNYGFAGKLDMIHFARIDPADSTHLSFDCIVAGTPATYDVYLQNDGDDLNWNRRGGMTPVVQAPTPAPHPAAPGRIPAP